VIATHVLGVALPEETFYRGYLQPRLETLWPPERRVFGVHLGLAAVVTAALFASGHFLGEWNPLRLGPFFPALLFAWLRNASGSVTGAVAYHGACNVLGEVLFALYSPV
jgi:membrane protease YdiL (CAAX protease family)